MYGRRAELLLQNAILKKVSSNSKRGEAGQDTHEKQYVVLQEGPCLARVVKLSWKAALPLLMG
jgi:hypothetical protein